MARLAGAQHGVATRKQLIEIGFAVHDIDERVSRGEFIALHRGVYAIAHLALSFEGRVFAAVLAGGSGAAASHFSAAALWGLPAGRRRIEISVPRSRRWNCDTVLVHRPHRLVDDIAIRRGIPVTSVARTLMDLAAYCSLTDLRRMLHEAETERLLDRTEVTERVRTTPKFKGARKLDHVLATNAGPSRKELERRFNQLIADSGLPSPRRNSKVQIHDQVFELDAWWPEARLVVELDSWRVHGTRDQFEIDRRRDELFLSDGIRVVRVTWLRVTRDSADLVRSLHHLLDAPGRR